MDDLFKIDGDPTFPCSVAMPVPGGASRILPVVFRWLSRDEYTALVERAKTAQMTDAEFFSELVESWVADVACDVEGMKRLFGKFPRAPQVLLSAYQHALTEAEEKN